MKKMKKEANKWTPMKHSITLDSNSQEELLLRNILVRLRTPFVKSLKPEKKRGRKRLKEKNKRNFSSENRHRQSRKPWKNRSFKNLSQSLVKSITIGSFAMTAASPSPKMTLCGSARSARTICSAKNAIKSSFTSILWIKVEFQRGLVLQLTVKTHYRS